MSKYAIVHTNNAYICITIHNKLLHRCMPRSAFHTKSFDMQSSNLSFSDHETAFRSKRTPELIRACVILAACSNDKIVDNSLQLLRDGERLIGKRTFGALMRHTLYAQFVAGETGPAVIEAAKYLQRQGLRLMVAPTLESDVGEDTNRADEQMRLQDRNQQELLKFVQLIAASEANFSFIGTEMRNPCLQLKMTALVPTEILVSLSNLIKLKLDVSDTSGYMKLVEEIGRIMTQQSSSEINIEGMNQTQCNDLLVACKRLQVIGQEAAEQRVRLLVDMEWSYVNPACSALASAMMSVFNKNAPAVCSTVQCYLKGALKTLLREEMVAQKLGVCYGAKLVRGAYIERERHVAPHLVCDSYSATSANYDMVMEAGVTSALSASLGNYFLVVATHNEAAVLNAAKLLDKLSANKQSNVVFAQIYGMAEHISLPLAQAGYTVYKSVAFGELSQVLPYLARRAAENRAVMHGARRERQLLMREIIRRLHLPF